MERSNPQRAPIGLEHNAWDEPTNNIESESLFFGREFKLRYETVPGIYPQDRMHAVPSHSPGHNVDVAALNTGNLPLQEFCFWKRNNGAPELNEVLVLLIAAMVPYNPANLGMLEHERLVELEIKFTPVRVVGCAQGSLSACSTLHREDRQHSKCTAPMISPGPSLGAPPDKYRESPPRLGLAWRF
ncbi:hypothetical protein K438DRAFT_1780548 [Mycena galopus ATCC 62051]|nr:hypothetical protein K438DRAFT_1780548 [Mycena galopus ATCC 62051]